jgi:Flp pilus assembly protein TadG
MARCRGDRGAVLMEAAVVLPVFLLVIFGVIEFGLAFSASATTTSTTREGARFGSANFGTAADTNVAADLVRDKVQERLKVLTGQDTPVKLWIFKANDSGHPGGLDDFSACATNCYQYTWTSGAFERTTTDIDPARWSVVDSCGNNRDSIGVYLEVNHTYLTGYLIRLVGRNDLISEVTVARLEPLPISQCPVGST